MISKGDKIIVGLSGGCDSVYLLYFLNSIKDEYALSLYACHLNHSIRGDEAVRDLDFSKNLAESLGIEFFSKTLDVPKMAKEKSLTTEEAGRIARYDFFESVSARLGGAKIATAHHADDNAETVLMHIIRGCGLNGLSGISAVRDNIIRPLINTSKDDIIAYLDNNGIKYITDSTNLENDYFRNSIRNELIPFIQEKYNPSFTSAINNLSQIAQETLDYVQKSATGDIAINKDENGVYCNVEDVRNHSLAVCGYVFKEMVQMLCSMTYDISSNDYENIYNLCKNSSTGKMVILPHAIKCRIVYDKLYFSKDCDTLPFEYTFKVSDQLYIKELDMTICAFYGKAENTDDVIRLDLKEDTVLTLRNRRSGDMFVPGGMSGHKKLKNFFIDLKIPQFERDRIPVIVKDTTIVAVGNRIAEGYETKDKEKNTLNIKFKKTRD